MIEQGQRNARVLILEDDCSLREVLEEVLRARGLMVKAAASGKEALELARSEPFDLIVADIRMKGLSGLEAIEAARRLQPDLSSIVVSGYASEEETLQAVRLNVAGYLKKPFKIPKLLELVNELLEKKNEKKRIENELRQLRRSLLWSIHQQVNWAEKAHPGEIEPPASLAYKLAEAQGLSPGLCNQIFSGTALSTLLSKSRESLPEAVRASLKPFHALLSSLEGDELSRFALAFGNQHQQPCSELGEFSDQLRNLYESLRLKESRPLQKSALNAADEEIVETENLFQIASNLEKLGDLSEAARTLEPFISGLEVSARSVRAHLICLRLALKSGLTKRMEQHVKDALAQAKKLGPAIFARTQWKIAESLRTVAHPAALKLYGRAAQNLAKLDQLIPWACCILTLASSEQDVPGKELKKAIQLLSDPEYRSEVAELVGVFLADLFRQAVQNQSPEALELCRLLVKGFYFELRPLLLGESNSIEVKLLALDLLKESGLGLPAEWLSHLKGGQDFRLSEAAERLSQRSEDSEGHSLRAHFFGSFSVTLDGRQLSEKDWKTQKSKYLFARLLRTSPRSINVEQVIEELWPDKPETSRKSLNTSVSNIRRIFRSERPGGTEILERVGETLKLSSALRVWSDEELFREAAKDAEIHWKSGEREKAMVAYGRMIRLHEGPYLDSCYLDWALICRSDYERQVELALLRLMEHRFSQHRFTESHEYATDLLRYQPDSTRAHEILMLSLMGLEKHQAATDHFEDYSRQIKAECASEPPVELLKVYQMARYGFPLESELQL